MYWTPVGHTAPSLDYFDKYVVTRVNYSDVNSLSPNQLTTYTYLGTPAWHFDDNELVMEALQGNRWTSAASPPFVRCCRSWTWPS